MASPALLSLVNAGLARFFTTNPQRQSSAKSHACRCIHAKKGKVTMSHFVSITTQIKDIDALREACTELGLQLLQNTEARGIGTQQRGEYVIRLKGPCDIALNRGGDGAYTLSADAWENHVENEVGPNYGRLLQLYAVHKTTREARKRGLAVQRSTMKGGAIKLTLAGGSL